MSEMGEDPRNGATAGAARLPSTPLLRGLTRRRLLGAGAGVAALATLAACGTPGQKERNADAPTSVPDRSDTDKIVNWSNWPEYIDVTKNGKHPTLESFTKRTGIKVNYTEDINDNDAFYAKLQPFFTQGQDTGRDLLTFSDTYCGRLINFGWVQELDFANMPNVTANLDPTLKDVSWDPGRKYSLPYQAGFTGIGYNTKATRGAKVETVEQLLTDPDLKGRVTLLTEMSDTMGMVMTSMDIDPRQFTDDEFDAAIDKLQKAVDAGQIANFTGNDYGKPLASGDIAACLAYTGDIVQLQADSKDLAYALPPQGHMVWSDNWQVPNLAQHKKNAELLINHYYDPKVAAELVDWVNYISPVPAAKDVLVKEDPEVANNPLIFPTDEVRARSYLFMGISYEKEQEYNRKFQAVLAG